MLLGVMGFNDIKAKDKIFSLNTKKQCADQRFLKRLRIWIQLKISTYLRSMYLSEKR